MIRFIAVLALLPGTLLAAANSWSLKSPNGQCAITVSLQTEGALTYQVSRGGKTVLGQSPLGVRREDEAFERGLQLEAAGQPEPHREVYELFAGANPHIDHVVLHRSLTFQNANHARLVLELAASDEGVAFRYRFPEPKPGLHALESELTGFALSRKARGWLQPYHAAGPYTPAYEDFYFHVSPGQAPPRSREKPRGWAFPALFQVPGAGGWVLLTESGTDESYCACHLAANSAGGLYRVAFAEADEATRGQTNHVGPEPRWTLPWTLPWRVIVLGQSAGEVALATLVTDLAPAARVADTSWIQPGRASWCWWSYPEGPTPVETFNQFTDFSARMGWEYTLFDAGWWKVGLSNLTAHACAQHVKPLAWCYAGDFYDPAHRQRKLDELKAAGVAGVKVDFWCSDRQEAMTAMQGLFADAAARHLVVNTHGCTLPRGWQRTWPNYLSAEAVLGTESYFYESRYTKKAAQLNTVLPFTRNAVGPMDLTPVACSPKKYPRTTTAAHELAAALVFTSGLIHYADRPEFFDTLPPEALEVLRQAPARWEETRCLLGEPGRVVVFARRAGDKWFIAGLNGTDGRLPVKLDFSAFKDFKQRVLLEEGPEARMQIAAAPVPTANRWQHRLPARGGFVLRLEK